MIIFNDTPTYYANNVTLDILVNGKPIKQYDHKDKIYVEGRNKSNYAIRVTNSNFHDVLAIISVDGMCVIDGKAASEDSRGWIVRANSTLDIPGWLVDNKSAAKFQFDDKKESYAEKSTAGSIKNVGVIGCIVYEKKQEILYRKSTWDLPKEPPWPSWPGNAGIYYDATSPVGNSADNLYGSGGILRSSFTASCASADVANSSVNLSNTSAGVAKGVDTSVKHELGTAFGSKTTFKTDEASFNKGAVLKTIVLYYDSKRNLEKMGIKFAPKPKKVQKEPNPFPASKNFCQPPKGW